VVNNHTLDGTACCLRCGGCTIIQPCHVQQQQQQQQQQLMMMMMQTANSSAAVGADTRLGLLQLRGHLLERMGIFFLDLQRQRQTDVERSATAAEEVCTAWLGVNLHVTQQDTLVDVQPQQQQPDPGVGGEERMPM
jgi:hypothetical protein